MAIFHMSSQVITRSKGHSSVKAAAYRHGAKMTDLRTGEEHDFTKKGRVDDTIILLPEGADERFKDSEFLWNTIEQTEKRKDSQLCREANIALMKDLTPEENKALAIEYCQKNFVDKGMIADIAFHNLDTDNPHFHVMLTMRQLTPDGKSFGNKNREWNDRERIEEWRKDWADTANEHLEKAGVDARIDHRSLAEQRKELLAIDNPSAEQQKQANELDRSPGRHKGKHFHIEEKVKASLSGDTPSMNPSPTPASSSNDAQNGAMSKAVSSIADVSSKAASVVKDSDKDASADIDDDKPEYQEYEPIKEEKEPKRGKEKKQGAAATAKGDGGAKSLSDHRDSHDKNLHLTEAQREELEELEAAEEKARKAYITESANIPDAEKPVMSDEEKKDRFKSRLKSTFNQVKKSFTEERFEEERKRHENRKRPKYT